MGEAGFTQRLAAILAADAAGYSSLMAADEASTRELVREVSTLQPDFSVARWAGTQPYRDLVALDRISTNLRSAGLPS